MTAELSPRQEGRVRAVVDRLCPGFITEGPAIITETSLLLTGRVHDRPVIAKHPIDPRPFWRRCCRHEIAIYRALAGDGPPPVQLPELVAADTDKLVLIITWLGGRTMSSDRYPTAPLAATQLTDLLDSLDVLHAWQPSPTRRLPFDDDYPRQLAQLADPLLILEDHALMDVASQIYARLGVQLEHGDAHPGNVLTLPGGDLALIDLEVAAWRPPGFDAAMLWVVLGPDPTVRHQILARIDETVPAQAAFWAAALLICTREIISHRRHAPTRAHRARLPRLAADMRTCREALHDLAHGLQPGTRP